MRDAFAGLFGGLSGVFGSGSQTEGDVVTTIEPTVQAYLEKVLTESNELNIKFI